MTGVAACDTVTQEQVNSAAAPRERGWWARWRRPGRPAGGSERPVDLNQLLGVLETAREQLASGWVQYGWWAVRRGSQQVLATELRQNPEPVEGVCLVGALVLAGRRHPAVRDEVGAAVDVVHEAVWHTDGTDRSVVVATPRARLARVRELTRWNDRPERTQQEVLAALDQAIAATIMRLVSTPAGDYASSRE